MSESLQRNDEEIEDIAKGMGLVVIYPLSCELILDLDSQDATPNPKVLNCMEDNGIEVMSTLVTKSKSGFQHVYLRTNKDFCEYERMGYQAALGSDPVKEVLSLLRANQGSRVCSVMFEKPIQAIRVRHWRKKFGV